MATTTSRPSDVGKMSGDFEDLAHLFEIDEDAIAAEQAKAPIPPKKFTKAQIAALGKGKSAAKSQTDGRYRFAVYVTRVPDKKADGSPYEARVEYGACDEFEASSETEAIRMFVQKYRLDPFGQGFSSHYSFKALFRPRKKGEQDPRPRPPYSGFEAQNRIAAYQAMRGKPVITGVVDAAGDTKSAT